MSCFQYPITTPDELRLSLDRAWKAYDEGNIDALRKAATAVEQGCEAIMAARQKAIDEQKAAYLEALVDVKKVIGM